MTTIAFVLLFVGALAGGFVSGLAGFGTALTALGIWLYVLPPPSPRRRSVMPSPAG
jgi:hypothetical protein